MRLNLTKKDIINSLYLQIGYPKNITENILEDLFDIIFDELKKNGKVKITNFGTFTVRKKNSRIGRNPKTKEEYNIASRNVITFKASKILLKYINNNIND